MLCAEYALVKRLGRVITIAPLWCKCWTCDMCRPKRRSRLVWEAKRGKPNLFVTLTTRRTPAGSPHAAARALAHAWRQVRREYITKHGKGSLPFLAVFEATKAGWPHLHIVARCKWLDQRWLSDRMKVLIGAPYVDVQRVKGTGKVENYIAKYIGKNPHRFEGTKRYWRSLDYLFPLPEQDLEGADWPAEFSIARFNWLTEVRYYVGLGYHLAMGTQEAVLTPWRPP